MGSQRIMGYKSPYQDQRPNGRNRGRVCDTLMVSGPAGTWGRWVRQGTMYLFNLGDRFISAARVIANIMGRRRLPNRAKDAVTLGPFTL